MADTSSANPPARNLRRSVLIGLTAVGMLVYVGIALYADAGRLASAARAIGAVGWVSILLLSLLNYILRFVRWDLFIGRLGQRLPRMQHLLYYLSGFTYTITPGKVGEAIRSVYLREHGVTLSASFAAIFAERLLDLSVVLLLATLGVWSSAKYQPLVLGVAAVIVAVLIAMSSSHLSDWIGRLRAHFPAGRIAGMLGSLARLVGDCRQLLRPQSLMSGLFLGVIAWGSEGVGFLIVCHGLGIPLTYTDAIGVYALALLAGNAAIFMPGGIGGTEIVMTALLTAHGASLPVAIIATLLCRLATLWFAVVLGFLATFLLEFGPCRRWIMGPA